MYSVGSTGTLNCYMDIEHHIRIGSDRASRCQTGTSIMVRQQDILEGLCHAISRYDADRNACNARIAYYRR